MDAFHCKRLPGWILCICTLFAAGCSTPTGGLSWMPFRERPTTLSGVKSPAERLAELEELADRASDASPQRQQQVTSELTAAIGSEKDPMIRAAIVQTLES